LQESAFDIVDSKQIKQAMEHIHNNYDSGEFRARITHQLSSVSEGYEAGDEVNTQMQLGSA